MTRCRKERLAHGFPVDRLNGTALRSCLRRQASRAPSTYRTEESRFAGQLTREAPPPGDMAGALTFRFLAGVSFGSLKGSMVETLVYQDQGPAHELAPLLNGVNLQISR
ncbi:hypothetical protein IscW_ISCW018683 [Ixodes scapularis]|uniref:Uncharacterized protein n=1 Tax=Ixodes scapularis TaxID=6945 RepID=B7PLF1_IXOSC|nr:hypothetical protein IscW_ISCW018683 [Ixodes scapularis]|eukprot:XP_002434599.1 hypothetical protein IscW_ISCW018683 [Ixodes scapularis]